MKEEREREEKNLKFLGRHIAFYQPISFDTCVTFYSEN